MNRFNKLNMLAMLLSALLILLSFSATTTWAAQETTAAPENGAVQEHPDPPDGSDFKIIPISMEMEAGGPQYKEWPGGGKTVHAGIGWIYPLGRAEYFAGMGYPEAEKCPNPSYFNEEWMETYNTNLFCIIKLEDGNIYAYDGAVGTLDPGLEDDGRMDYVINIIVGGSGAYEGATGVLLGRTPGRGKSSQVGEGVFLPVSILKLMDGYIKIPVKK